LPPNSVNVVLLDARNSCGLKDIFEKK